MNKKIKFYKLMNNKKILINSYKKFKKKKVFSYFKD